MAYTRFFDPTALKRIHQLELRARYIMEGFLSGMHRSPFFGNSAEFLQHRQYIPGDEIRKIDWKIWGKQDKLYVKQFQEDTNLRATLLIDSSESMCYERLAPAENKKAKSSFTPGMSKYEYAATLAVSLAYLLLKQQDSVGAVRFDEKIRQIIPQRTRQNHLNSLIQTLDIETPSEKTDMEPILRTAAETFPNRGMMILFSDLLVPREGFWNGLKALRSHRHDVIVFHILDDDELDFPFQGPSRFEGLETLDILRCNPRSLRAGYMEALNEYLEEIRTGCIQQNVDYVLVRTSDPFDKTLSKIVLSRRQTIKTA
ncbi:MAG: DUF58 domain-containing protein [Planctomycetia bacterium]|nr:DUF58 domain-containing protein [Planctomycetia bacterium]